MRVGHRFEPVRATDVVGGRGILRDDVPTRIDSQTQRSLIDPVYQRVSVIVSDADI
jgi:hypothetical protein